MIKKAIILGAGPSGLISGWLLAKSGWKVEIYEMKNQVGGMCRSWKWKNQILDTGPHIFHTHDKKLEKFWKENFKEILLEGEYWAKNILGNNLDQIYDYPLSHESFKRYPLEIRKKIKSEFIKLKKNKTVETSNFSQFIENQVGKTLTSMFFKDYPEKVWGVSTKKMTADWAPKRIKITKKSMPFFNTEYTAVAKFGTGTFYEKIRKKIEKLGGKIILNSRVVKLNTEKNDIKEIILKNKKEIKMNKEDVIISSLPITLTAKFLGYNSELKFRGIRSTYILLNKTKIFPKKINWLYFSNKKIIFNRVSEPKNMSKYVCSKGKTYLCVETTYEKNDHIDKINLKQMSKRVIEDLTISNLIKKEDVIAVSENKEDFVYPVQFTNYKYELSKTKNLVSKYNQIYSLGVGGDFDYTDSQTIFHKSIDLVDILNQKHDSEVQVKKRIKLQNLNKIVRLGKSNVGNDLPTFIIAEAGLNHNGDINLAKKLIDGAVKTGCNAIKFQTFKASSRVSRSVKSVRYAEKADGLQEDLFEMFDRISLSKSDFKKIFSYAKKRKIEIFSTPFSEEDVDFLESLNTPFYKLASVDCVNLPLIKKVGKTGKPLILSTGMTDLSVVEDAVNTFKMTGNANLILLHCLSSYPSDEKEMNLKAINTLKSIYNIPVGLSDHYPGLEISFMAIGLGANIIERHFTLNKSFEGPDHILSSEPDEMEKLVNIANLSNIIIGDGQKKIQPSEYLVINTQRKCLYAKKFIKKGDFLSKKNITIKGPAGGILPKHLSIVEGKRAKENIGIDEPITWELI